jgi:hypothetical protein
MSHSNARVYTKFGSREVGALYDDVISGVLNLTERGTEATDDDYQKVFDAVAALDEQIASEMELSR